MVGSACFPSSTKTGGMETALRLTPLTSVLGVLLKQNMNMSFGATALLTVSIALVVSYYSESFNFTLM